MRLSIQTIFHLFSLTIIFSPALLYLINPSQNIQSIQPFLSQIFSRSNPSYPRYSVDPTRPILDIQSIQPVLSQISSQSNLFLSQISSQSNFSSPRYPVKPTLFLSQISSQFNPFSPRYPANPTLFFGYPVSSTHPTILEIDLRPTNPSNKFPLY